ncbi:MAG: alpha/beta fold hydrolase [Thermoleophilia bacterium]
MAAPRPILIHGSGGDHRVFARQAERFGGSVAIDLPGHPEGDPAAGLAAAAAALGPALESIDGPRVLVGHSLGGAVSLEVARARPELVDGLVLIATGARLPVPDRVLARAEAEPGGEIDRLMAGFFADPDHPSAEAVRRALADCGPRTLLADYRMCAAIDLRGRLDGVRVPALVIAGGDDRLTPVWLGEELARELPAARMAVVAGAMHMVMAEHPGPVNLLLAGYLARLELTLDGA